MKRGLGLAKGFTIVETMIFLAVSSALLVSALTVVSGAQNKTEFTQAINDINQIINDTFNNVATGYYPYTQSAKDHTCGVTAPDANGVIKFTPAASPASDTQGKAKDCIFIGRVLQFTDGEEVRIYTAVGKREVRPSVPAKTLGEARAVLASNANDSSFPDLTETIRLKNGITLKQPKIGAQDINGIAFLSTLGDQDSANTDLVRSGSQVAEYAPIHGALNATKVDVENWFNANSNALPSATELKLHFQSGGTKQCGTITIGTDGQQSATNLEISDGDCP